MAEPSPATNSRDWLYGGIILVLLLVIGAQYYLFSQANQELEQANETKEMELTISYAKLDSISTQLENKIQALEQLNENVDSLVAIQAELEQEKAELLNASTLNRQRYLRIRDKIEGYEVLLRKKDEEIATLRAVNRELMDENIGLKSEIVDTKDQISSLQSMQQELNQQLSKAAVLRIRNIEFVAIDKKGRERTGPVFKARHLDKLKVNYFIEPNDLVDVGTKNILVVIREETEDGPVLYNTATGSDTFTFKGKELVYTTKDEILFDNQERMETVIYDKGARFKKFKYHVTLYEGGNLMGKGEFIVK